MLESNHRLITEDGTDKYKFRTIEIYFLIIVLNPTLSVKVTKGN